MNEVDPIKLAIRSAMQRRANTTNTANTANTTIKSKQTQTAEHGKLGDFSRSNSNPTSRTVSNSASVGFEEVTRPRLNLKYEANKANGKTQSSDNSLSAEFETIRKAVRIAIDGTSGAPSKRAVKRMAAPKMTRSDRVFKTTGPGSSRSATLDAIKAIAAKETGCIVRDPKHVVTAAKSAKNANTTQGNYNPMIVE